MQSNRRAYVQKPYHKPQHKQPHQHQQQQQPHNQQQQQQQPYNQQQQQQQPQHTISLEDLKEVFRKNPFQSECVPHIQIERYVADVDNEIPEEEGWIRRPLGIGGPMALILRSKNHMYHGGSAALQKVLLREAITESQNNSPALLKGRKWPLRRVSEALSSCLNSKIPEGQTSAWNEMCYSAICEMEQIQIMIIDTDTKTIAFSPSDIRNWKSNSPIYAMSKDGQWLFAPCNAESEAWPVSKIGLWISDKEANSWKINWPIAEGTMEQMRDILEEAGLPVEGRLKKEELARRTGKTGAIKLLSGWVHSENIEL